jgi:hypothetical protein
MEGPLYRLFILSRSINKHGHHRTSYFLDLKRHNHASAFFRAIVDLYEKESNSTSESYLRFHPYD